MASKFLSIGSQAISLLATSDYTRKICEKDGGWVVFKEQAIDFYREAATGKPLFPTSSQTGWLPTLKEFKLLFDCYQASPS